MISHLPATPLPPGSSPCVGTCLIDERTGLCRGCARTIGEVAEWGDAPEPRRRQIWSSLPARYRRLGISISRLAWGPVEILDLAEHSVRTACGTWVLGVHGAIGEFNRDPGEMFDLVRTQSGISVTTPRAAMTLSVDEAARVLVDASEAGKSEFSRLVFAVPDSPTPFPVAEALTFLGEDDGALRASDRTSKLFDLGLGRGEARFCVRTSEPEIIRALSANEGRELGEYLGRVSHALIAHGPTRVIETGLGRLEIETEIPPPGGNSPQGPHTHLLPAHLARGRSAPPGIEMPEGYVVGAIFYPSPAPG